MSARLAFVLHHIWHPNETFIRRQVEGLLPGAVAAVAQGILAGCKPDFPVLKLDPDPGSAGDFTLRLLRKLQLVSRCPSKLPLNRLQDWRIRSFFKKQRVVAVLGQFMDSSLRFLPLASRLGIPFYVHAHGYDISKSLRDPYWAVGYREYNDSAGVIVMSKSVKARLVAIGILGELVHVIPYGVDVPPQPPLHPMRCGIKVLAVGRMNAKKAPLLTLEAFRIAHRACPDLHLDFIGDGEMFLAASRFVQESHLAEAVSLLGLQDHAVVRRKMKEADMFVQHSIVDPATGDEEGLPVAILEAMASGLPVVSTRHAGIPEAVLDGKTGLLVEEGDVKSMAERIVELGADYAMRRKLGDAAWQRAKDYYTWERERESLLRVLKLGAGGRDSA